MPPLGLLIGGVNFTDLKWVMKGPEVVDGVEQAAVTLNYGNFLQATFDFLIIAFSIFLFIRLLTKLTEKKKEEQTAPAPAPAPSEEVKLLSEIRDLLKKNEEWEGARSLRKIIMPLSYQKRIIIDDRFYKLSYDILAFGQVG